MVNTAILIPKCSERFNAKQVFCPALCVNSQLYTTFYRCIWNIDGMLSLFRL